jgi:N-dimethylarginine dimethylaminohydrolase
VADRKTLAVGRGYRTNDEGIRQLRQLLGDGVGWWSCPCRTGVDQPMSST